MLSWKKLHWFWFQLLDSQLNKIWFGFGWTVLWSLNVVFWMFFLLFVFRVTISTWTSEPFSRGFFCFVAFGCWSECWVTCQWDCPTVWNPVSSISQQIKAPFVPTTSSVPHKYCDFCFLVRHRIISALDWIMSLWVCNSVVAGHVQPLGSHWNMKLCFSLAQDRIENIFNNVLFLSVSPWRYLDLLTYVNCLY